MDNLFCKRPNCKNTPIKMLDSNINIFDRSYNSHQSLMINITDNHTSFEDSIDPYLISAELSLNRLFELAKEEHNRTENEKNTNENGNGNGNEKNEKIKIKMKIKLRMKN